MLQRVKPLLHKPDNPISSLEATKSGRTNSSKSFSDSHMCCVCVYCAHVPACLVTIFKIKKNYSNVVPTLFEIGSMHLKARRKLYTASFIFTLPFPINSMINGNANCSCREFLGFIYLTF